MTTEANGAIKRDDINLGGKVHPAVKIAKLHAGLLVSLAVKLRLCPSTRMRAVSAKAREIYNGARPWEAI